jgi:hypothetical protein
MALKKVNSDWLDTNLKDIADALRSKGITSDDALAFTETSNEMADVINAITERDSDDLTVGSTVSAPAGYYAETARKTIPTAILTASGSASATISATPGTVSIANKSASVTNKIQITASPSTSTSSISKYYMAVNATAAESSASGDIGGKASAWVRSAGYAGGPVTGSGSISGTATVDIEEKTSDTYYLPIATGSCTVSGGGLTAGSGAVSATGTNVSLTELSAAPSSGAYITVTGSGSVSRAAITKNQTAGYISAGSSTSSNATSKSSNTATKYYAIATNDDIYLYGVYQFISTPTGSGLPYDWSTTTSEPITFGWTESTTGTPGSSYDQECHKISVNYGVYGLVIRYDNQVAYTTTTYSNISSYTGWQTLDGIGTATTRTIIIATPYRISSSSTFYQWFSNNTERVGDWSGGTGGGGGLTTVDTATVNVNGYASGSSYGSGETHFYYTASENGQIVAKHVTSTATRGATLYDVVVGTYVVYHCDGSVAISSDDDGATWINDISWTAYNMSIVYQINTTGTIRFSGYTDCCFEGTSQILMADGTTKNLSEISIGEKLITYNEQTGVNEINEVTALGTAAVNHNTIIVLEDGTIIQMNKYHPLWTEDGWKSIVRHRNLPKLTEADKLMNNNGDYVAIKSIEEVEIDTATYYTIKVANNNNFYVNGYLAQGKDKD